MNGIEARGLVKRYGDVTAVDALNLSIPQGSLYALLGVNGAGKTTAIRMLCGLTKMDAGEAWIMEHSISRDLQAVRRITAVSPQETAVAPRLTVSENLELIAEIHGADRAEARKMQKQMLAQMDLQSVANRPAGKLSGGWQRRLSIAMALISRPQVLFLDEPTLGLDVLTRRSLWELIQSLRGQTTILLTTHYLEEAETLADCIGVMRSGRLVAQGSAEELCALVGCDRFEDAFVALAAPKEGKE